MISILIFRNFVILERIFSFLGRNNFCSQKINVLSSFVWKSKYIDMVILFFLGRIDFCWKEIILLKFQKNFFWQEKYYSGKNLFCFVRNTICWQKTKQFAQFLVIVLMVGSFNYGKNQFCSGIKFLTDLENNSFSLGRIYFC